MTHVQTIATTSRRSLSREKSLRTRAIAGATRNHRLQGNARLVLIGVTAALVSIVAGAVWMTKGQQASTGLENAITFEVFRGDFLASVVESGDMESSQSQEVRLSGQIAGPRGHGDSRNCSRRNLC